MGAQARVEPGLAAPDVLGVDRQPLAQREAAVGGARGELVDLRPGALGVDVVGRQRRDAAPVVDAGPQHQGVLGVDEVRRRLHARLRAEHEPGHRDRGGEFLQVGVRHGAHRGVRLGAEVLDDDLLDRRRTPGRPCGSRRSTRPGRARSRRCRSGCPS